MREYSLLVVDDIPMTADCLKKDIPWGTAGITNIFCAYDAVMAKKILDSHSVDVMITDIKMPGKDGLEFISSILDSHRSLKIILYSAYGSFEYAQRAIEYGVRFFLCKPCPYNEILEKVKLCLSESVEQDKKGRAFQARSFENGGALVRGAKQYIEENLHKNPTLAEIAAQLHVSQSHLSRIFKAEEGLSVVDYMISRRISHSIELLSKPGLRVSDIPELLGYESLSYFSRVFKRETGYSPKEYIDRYL